MADRNLVRDVKEVFRRLRNRGISLEGNRQYPAIPTIDNTVESHTNALRAMREAIETHERRNSRAALDSFVRLYELEDALGGFEPGESTITNIYNTTVEGGTVEFATLPETDAGVISTKAIHPQGGAYAYDRFRYWGQHAAGKGTEVVTLAISASTVTINCRLSNVFEVELTENVTFATPTNPIDGQVINVIIRQDGTGGRTATWSAAWAFFGGTPSISTTAGATDLISCQYDSTLGLWLASFLSGAGAASGGSPYTLANIGTGAFIYKETVDVLGTDTARLRSIKAGPGITVTQNADEVEVKTQQNIYVQSTAPTSPAVGDLWFW